MKTFSLVPVLLGLLMLGLAACRAEERAATAPGSQKVVIQVTDEGFVPNDIRVKAGQPLTLSVTRTSDRTCATELVLKEYGINQDLPLGKTIQISFTPKQSGKLTYACAMDMFKGHITVE